VETIAITITTTVEHTVLLTDDGSIVDASVELAAIARDAIGDTIKPTHDAYVTAGARAITTSISTGVAMADDDATADAISAANALRTADVDATADALCAANAGL